MSEAALAPAGLRKRSALLAALLAYFVSPVAFAYVGRLGWGIAFLLASPAIMLVAGWAGIPFTVAGHYALLAVLFSVVVAAIVFAIGFARRLPVGAAPRWYNRWYHYCWIGGFSLLLGYGLSAQRGKLFGYESFRIPSSAMQPTLRPGDFIVADFRDVAMSDVRRGDIVVFEPTHQPGQRWVKRVIGLPGETVEVRGNEAIVDGKPLAGLWRTINEPVPSIRGAFEHVALGTDDYFLMGDNRPNSEDSRFTGPIKREALQAKVRAIWLHFSPFTRSIDTSRIRSVDSSGKGE